MCFIVQPYNRHWNIFALYPPSRTLFAQSSPLISKRFDEICFCIKVRVSVRSTVRDLKFIILKARGEIFVHLSNEAIVGFNGSGSSGWCAAWIVPYYSEARNFRLVIW